MNQQAGALDVAKKIMPESGTLGGTGNQARNIGKDRAISGRTAHHTEIGHQGCEGVIGDLGTGCRQDADQRAFAGIGQTDDSDLGQQLQFKLERPLLSVATFSALFGRTVAVAQIVGISQTAAASERHHELLSRRGQITHEDAGGEMSHLRSAGNMNDQRLARRTGAAIGAAPTTISAGKQSLVLEIQQRLKIRVSLEDHVGSMPPITA